MCCCFIIDRLKDGSYKLVMRLFMWHLSLGIYVQSFFSPSVDFKIYSGESFWQRQLRNRAWKSRRALSTGEKSWCLICERNCSSSPSSPPLNFPPSFSNSASSIPPFLHALPFLPLDAHRWLHTTYSYKFSSVVELLRVFYRLMKVYALKKTQIALNGFKHTSISKVLERYMNGCRQRLVK